MFQSQSQSNNGLTVLQFLTENLRNNRVRVTQGCTVKKQHFYKCIFQHFSKCWIQDLKVETFWLWPPGFFTKRSIPEGRDMPYLTLERIKMSLLWDNRTSLNARNGTYAPCLLLHIVEPGIFCVKPQARKASRRANMFDWVISIRNPAFRSQNLNDNATDEKNRSPAHSTARIYAFWEAVGGQIAALKSWNMPKVFVLQSCGPTPPMYTNRCGPAHQAAGLLGAPQHHGSECVD